MAIFALVSPGGSPGVTTAGLALALGWPSPVILAECDPSGGDVLAGLLGGHLPASTGLLPLALEAGAGTEVPGDALWRQLIELDTDHSRLLLAGISDPRQSAALQSSLPWIAEALQGAAADVIADCGRLDSVAAVRPVLSAASLAVLVLRPTLRQLSRAVPRAEMLTSLVGRERVVALLAGTGGASAREAARALGVPVAGQLADDTRAAAVLSDGLGSRSRLPGRPLLRSATTAGKALREAAAAAGPLPGTDSVFSPYDDAPHDHGLHGHVPHDGEPAASRRVIGQPALGQPVFGQPPSGQPAFQQPRPGAPGPGVPDQVSQQRQAEPGSGQPGLPGRPLRAPGQPDRASGWPAPGWPEDDWPEARRSGSSWSGSGGRHAAGRADDTDPGRGTGSTPPGGASGASYLSAFHDPAASTQNGSSPNGHSPNGHSPNGHSPNGHAPHDGPGGGSGETGGRG